MRRFLGVALAAIFLGSSLTLTGVQPNVSPDGVTIDIATAEAGFRCPQSRKAIGKVTKTNPKHWRVMPNSRRWDGKITGWLLDAPWDVWVTLPRFGVLTFAKDQHGRNQYLWSPKKTSIKKRKIRIRDGSFWCEQKGGAKYGHPLSKVITNRWQAARRLGGHGLQWSKNPIQGSQSTGWFMDSDIPVKLLWVRKGKMDTEHGSFCKRTPPATTRATHWIFGTC